MLQTSARAPAAWRSPAVTGACYAVFVSLVLPFALLQVSAALTRASFPGFALLVGLITARFWPERLAAVAVVFCAFDPFLRRVADAQLGFVQSNPILLGPLVVMIPAAPALCRRLLNPGPLRLPMLLMTGCVLYAAFLALFADKIVQGLYEPAWWMLPPALAMFVVEHRAEANLIRRILFLTLALIMPVIALYGANQYLHPAPWDVLWMQNVNNPTFGEPLPMLVRVFATLNSPGTTSFFVVFALLFLFGEGGVLGLIGGIACLPLLLLTLVRTAWFSAAAGLLCIVIFGQAKRRLQLTMVCLLLAGGAVVLAGNLSVPMELRDLVLKRFESLTSLQGDSSAQDRLETYASFYDRLADSPLGEGFGANASALATSQKSDLPPLDSWLLMVALTFGVPVGSIYIVSLGLLVRIGWLGFRASRDAMSGQIAVVCAVLVNIPFGFSLETGSLQWSALGLLLASAIGIPALPGPALGRQGGELSLSAPAGESGHVGA